MSEDVQAAQARIASRSAWRGASMVPEDPALVDQTSRLLAGLTEQAAPHSASTVFELREHELGLPGVRLIARLERQAYLRGTVNALECMIENYGLEKLQRCGVIAPEHSPLVQDMAIAASNYGIPALVEKSQPFARNRGSSVCLKEIVLAAENMSISSNEKPAAVAQEAAIQFPLHGHVDVVHGQGTISLQLERDVRASVAADSAWTSRRPLGLGVVISDMGNGSTLSGICKAMSRKDTQVFAAAPSDGFWAHAARPYSQDPWVPQQSDYWKDVEVPMGAVPWSTFTQTNDLSAVFEVDYAAMCAASEKVLEHCGVYIHPDEAAPLAVAMFNRDFRRTAAERSGRYGGGSEWIIGVILQSRRLHSAGEAP